jgi:hypothetical protein
MYRKIFLLVVALCIAACSAIPQATAIVPTKSTPEVTYTLELTSTPLPTQIFTATPTASSTATVTGFPLPLPVSNVVQHCLVADERLPADFIVEGQLVRRCSEGLCLVDFQNQEINQSTFVQVNSGHRIGRGNISPNMNWLAYEDDKLDNLGEIVDRQLWLASLETWQQVVSWKPEWTYGWVDNEWLVVHVDWNEPTYHKVLLNPFTANTKEITLPPIHNPYPGDLLITDPAANYDTSFTRVIYLYVNPKSYYVTYALWNVQADELLWEKDLGTEMAWPEWSPDEQWLAVVSEVQKNRNELFIVDRDGQNETQLTNLATTYP